jgi:hypothetical protein
LHILTEKCGLDRQFHASKTATEAIDRLHNLQADDLWLDDEYEQKEEEGKEEQ